MAIAVSPWRSGFETQLRPISSRGNGNGPFGLGWGLSVPGIIRNRSKGIPRDCDGDKEVNAWDTVVLSGAENLVPFEDLSLDPLKATMFRSRTEGLVPTIIHRHEAQDGATCWQVCSKEGLISYKSMVRPDPMSRSKRVRSSAG